MRIALLVKLAIKATDNSDMYNRAFPVGNALFLFAGGVMNLFRLPCGKLAFAQRSGAMKAPVGLLSGSAVCDSRWRGVAPTSAAPTRSHQNSQELQK